MFIIIFNLIVYINSHSELDDDIMNNVYLLITHL